MYNSIDRQTDRQADEATDCLWKKEIEIEREMQEMKDTSTFLEVVLVVRSHSLCID